MTIDPAVLARARQVLTDKQFEVWQLKAEGWTVERIMFRCDLHKSSVRDRLAAADLNLLRAGIRMNEATRIYYLQEPAA